MYHWWLHDVDWGWRVDKICTYIHTIFLDRFFAEKDIATQLFLCIGYVLSLYINKLNKEIYTYMYISFIFMSALTSLMLMERFYCAREPDKIMFFLCLSLSRLPFPSPLPLDNWISYDTDNKTSYCQTMRRTFRSRYRKWLWQSPKTCIKLLHSVFQWRTMIGFLSELKQCMYSLSLMKYYEVKPGESTYIF